MSSINVSLYDISSFKSSVDDLRYEMSRNYDSFSYIASTLQSKASTAIGNAEEKITLMNQDLVEIGFVLKHNNELLQVLYVRLKAIEEREKVAVEQLEQAQAAQTNANNSSSGSTEEEKKAHEAAVKSANSAVNSASSYLSSIRREKKEVQNTIYRAEQAVRRLEEMKRNIIIYRSGAVDYISDVKTNIGKFNDKRKSYEEVYKKCYNDVSLVSNFVQTAETSIRNALSRFAEAFNKSTADNVNVTSTNVIANTASLLRSIKSTVETYSKKQRESMKDFMETLGDDVSVATAKMGRVVVEECIKQTKDFDKMADYLMQAKKYLDQYTALINRI